MTSHFWWSTDELGLVLDLYRKGKSLNDIYKAHSLKYPYRSFSAVRTAIYKYSTERRKCPFSEEENEWIQKHLDMKPKDAHTEFCALFGYVNIESLRSKIYLIRRKNMETD